MTISTYEDYQMKTYEDYLSYERELRDFSGSIYDHTWDDQGMCGYIVLDKGLKF